MSFKNMGVRTKIMAGVCVPLLMLMLAGGYLTTGSIESLIETSKRVEHTNTVLGNAMKITGFAVDMETGMRGYLLAGREEFLRPYRKGEKAAYDEIRFLQKKVDDNPEQVKLLKDIEKTLKEWQDKVVKPNIVLRRKIGDAETMNDMARRVGEARGKKYFDRLRNQITTFISRENELVLERRKASDAARAESTSNLETLHEARKWVEHTHNVIAEAELVLTQAVNMETGMRGFLLAGEDEFLEPYYTGEKQIFAKIRELQKTVKDNPPQVEKLEDAEKLIREWINLIATPAIALRREVNVGTKTMEDADAYISEKKGKRYFDAFREKIAAFNRVEADLIINRGKSVEDAAAGIVTGLKTMNEANKWVNHTHNVIQKAMEIQAAAVDMETGMRGFLLAGKEGFLEPYADGEKRFFNLVSKLKEIVNDNPAQVSLLGEIEESIRAWKKEVTEPAIALRKKIGDAETMDDMADLIGKAEGKDYFDKFRQSMSEFRNEEERLMEERREKNTYIANRTIRGIKWGLLPAVILGLAISFFIADRIRKPLAESVVFVKSVARGDFDADIDIDQKDEAGVLVHTLQEMKGKISDVLNETDNQIRTIREGRLDTRIDAESYDGGWRELVLGINKLLDTLIAPINMTAEHLDRISAGDIPEKITAEYKGDFNRIKNNLNQCIDAVNGLVDEAAMLTGAAVEGRLSVRGDVTKFTGDYARIVKGVNDTLDAVIEPLNVAAESMARIGKGDIPEKIIRKYNGNFNEIKTNLNMLINGMNEVTLIAEKMAAGNLTVKVRERSGQDKLMQALNLMIKKLNEIVTEVKSASDNVASGNRQISASSEKMSQGAAEQAASAEEVSASMEEMSGSIRQSADNALQTEKIAMKSAQDAQRGSQAVNETVDVMKKITKKISIIEVLAAQTDLLALNAAIEAARAGKEGKGFAVVASEVRKLAERSKKAAAQIIKLSATSVEVAEKAGEMLERLVPNIQKTAELVQEISAASDEQDRGAKQINNAIQQLDMVIQQNASLTEGMASTSEELAGQAEHLRNLTDFFTVDDMVQKTELNPKKSAKTTGKKSVEIRPKVSDKPEQAEKPAGYEFELDEIKDEVDEMDTEFEKY
ncbi:CHASE3 domain-containing protein [Desulfobacterales bacterium HSG16]|nr:CHASE3 domain-containing protein [Desulfobacterales bacterium HSG16]